MCGIVGFVSNQNKKEKEKIIRKMATRINHRGPDSEGFYVSDKVALGFKRLSIIDLKGGSQPIYNEDDSKAIIFNGEIYNFQELRSKLEKKGHKFKTNADTEVILHGYEEYGSKILDKLRGMFAFVIWDIKKNEMFGARDNFGIKPFYYYQDNDVFMFSSEIKSFLEHHSFKKEVNKDALKPYLTFQFSALEETFFKGVYKLLPGCCFTYKDGKLEINKYYDVKFTPEEKPIDYYSKEIQEEVDESVKYHKISDVKVGAFLSGGVDSSYIAATLMPNNTFSVGFEREHFNEVDQAKDLSNILGIENINKIITPEEFFGSLEDIMYYCDEPEGNLSTVPLYFLSRLAREHVTVVLSGEGADELFAGYECYAITKQDLMYRKIPKFIRHGIGKIAFSMPWFHGRKFLIRNGLSLEEYFTGSAFIFTEKDKKKVVRDKYLTGKDFREVTKPIFDKVKDMGEVTKMQYLDFHLWMPEDILLKADKMTMASSLELRVPFLDKEVMKVAEKIPDKYKITNDTTKYVFRRSAYEKLPEEWAKRPKWGFPVPFHYWIREEKYYNIVKEEFKKDYVNEFFYQDEILKLLDDHYYKGKQNGRKIYVIYAFLLWYKRYFILEK